MSSGAGTTGSSFRSERSPDVLAFHEIQFGNICVRTASSPASKPCNVRASSIRTPTNSRRCCASRQVSRASRNARSGSSIPISSNSAMMDRTTEWRPTPVIGRLPDSVSNTAAAVASSSLSRSCRARLSSSTGQRTGRSSPVNGPNCRSPTSSCPTVAPFYSELTCYKHTRCCSTPIIMLSAF